MVRENGRRNSNYRNRGKYPFQSYFHQGAKNANVNIIRLSLFYYSRRVQYFRNKWSEVLIFYAAPQTARGIYDIRVSSSPSYLFN